VTGVTVVHQRRGQRWPPVSGGLDAANPVAQRIPDRNGGVKKFLPSAPASQDTPPLTPGQLDVADAVLTTSATAIAVTGAVILDHGPGRGRRALTLLPDQHICLVREDQIAPTCPRR
jgi:hypothetical protein